ncbi:MAG: IS1595 family transposase [Fibromonadales bacterium]|nr:IS1595 family transposase [Fibromonadales bacterium]
MKKLGKNTYKPNTAMSEDQFRAKFSTEHKTRKYLEWLIWGKKPRCPYCGSINTGKWNRSDGRKGWHRCYNRECKRQFTIRVGTVFEHSKIPLRKWMLALYYIVTDRKGISSMALSKKLGISYKYAWFLQHRIRHGLDSGNFNSLLGGLGKVVQSDETYAGGRNKNRHKNKKVEGSGPVGKAIILGLSELGGRKKAVVISNTERETIMAEINRHVRKGSVLSTDEATHYSGASRQGYKHRSCNHSAKKWIDGMASTNDVEMMWSLLKRAFYGIFHKFSIEHLQKYVAESVFRLNEGHCKYQTMDRVNAIVNYCQGKRLTWAQCVGEVIA